MRIVNRFKNKNRTIFAFFAVLTWAGLSCQKTTTAPNVSGVAALTVVNAIPNDVGVVPVIGTSGPIPFFNSANTLQYENFYEYSPIAGNDTVYAVQSNNDTLNLNPKTGDLMFYNILPLKKGGIYSLFLCGADTTSPDYLFTIDSVPYYNPTDSAMGVRFVNISTGSNPISINLEGSPNGSEVSNLPYKSITGFKQYACNSTTNPYLFVVRDQATGDSLTEYSFETSGNNGYGLLDPHTGTLLTFKNVTIAVYGSETNMNVPLSAMLIEDY